MSANSEIAPGFKEKIVFTIQNHNKLGTILAPCLVHVNKSGEFSYFNQRLHLHTIPKHLKALNEAEKQVFVLLDECADMHLIKKFSKKARTPAELYAELDEARMKALVIPYVQTRIDKSLIILRDAGVPLYYKGEKNEHVRSRPVRIIEEVAKAVFHFEKDATGSRYRMSLRYAANGPTTDLGSRSLVLVNKPGWLLVGDKVFQLEDGVEGMKAKPFFTKEYIRIPQSSEENYFRSFVTKAIQKYEVRLKGIELADNKPACIPVLKLENDWTGTPVFLLTFRYDDKQCRHPDEKPCWVEFQIRANAFIFTRTIRDKDSESSIIEFLLNNGLISTDKVVFRLDTAPEETDGFKASIRHSFQQAFDEAGINANEALEGESGVEDSTEDHLLHRAIDWLVSHETPLREHGVQIEQNFHQQRYFTGNIRIEMQFTSKIDWFDVFAYAIFGEHRIPFPKLRKHLRKGNRRYQLPDGEIAILPEEWFAKYSRLLAFGKPDKENIRLQKHHFTIFNDLVDDVHQVGEDKPGQAASGKKGQVSDIRQRSAELVGLIEKESIPLPDIPVELKDILRPYQAKGFAWMHLLGEQGFGGCLADDMGLGKTLQCLTLLWKHKLDYRPEPLRHAPISKEGLQLDLFNDVANTAHHAGRTSLIVMPLSLIHNWENEIRKFTPGLSCIRYYGQNRESRPEVLMKHDLVLTTYGMVRNDLDFLGNFHFYYAILDESQLIKNPDSKVSRAVQRLKAENRLVLTGTPVENSLTDLWAQINFLNPGLLGNRKFFQKSFAIPIEKGGHENKQSALKKIIEPFILRRTKALVEKDLPDLTEKLHYCEMDAAQKRLYESKKSEIRNSIFAKAAGEDKSTLRFDILRGLMQLRLIANHPGLASKKGTPHPAAAADPYMALTDNENGFEPSGKFNEAIRIIENLRAEGHKLLIFSQFVKHLRLYRNFFDASNWGYAYLSGSQNALERQQAISAFREDAEKNLFLISLKAGGTGLNLTEADYVLLLDPWWNPAVEQQAISRAHRIGQQKPVIAYKFITSNTVEEKILKLQQKKTNLATDLIGTNDPFRLFSETEMIKILE